MNMKRFLAGIALCGAVLAPCAAQAHGYHDGPYHEGRDGGYQGEVYYAGGYGYHDGPGVIGAALALPFVAAATVVDVAATVATAPFRALAPQPVYYPPAPAYYAPPPPRVYYYAPPPPAYYRAPPVYYRAPPPGY